MLSPTHPPNYGTSTAESQSETVSIQIQFARHIYDNQQALLRQLDTKAGVMLSLLVFLTGAALPLAKDVSQKLHMTGKGAFTSWSYLISSCLLITGVVATALCTQQVITARSSMYRALTKGLMFAPDVIAHSTHDAYHEATATAQPQTLLRTLTAEIYQLSGIAIRKMWWLSVARIPTALAGIAWAVNSFTAAIVFTWK